MTMKEKLEERYEKEVWGNRNLGEALQDWANRYQDKTAVCFDGRRYSYLDLKNSADAVAVLLKNMGFQKGDRVVLQLPNSYDFIAIAFGMFQLGMLPVFALPAQRKREIYGILDSAKAVAYLIPESYMGFDYLGLAEEVRSLGYQGKVLISSEFMNEVEQLQREKREETAKSKYERIPPSEVAFYLLSGGTTGIPKLIPRRHGDYLYMASQIAKRCQLGEDSVYLVSLPIEHNFPWGCPGVIGTLNSGGKVVVATVSSPDEILALMEEEAVTISALVPVLANMCIDLLEYEDYDLTSLRLLQVGGSVLEPQLAMRIEERFGCVLQQVFGIAEGLICTTKIEDCDEIRFYTQGTPVSEYDEPRIVDEEGKDLPLGSLGHLITRGPYTIYGYYQGKKEAVNEEGYFLTGDRARIREDGNIQVTGRMMEMINRGGEKIDPTELEDLLVTHPDIEDVQVVGVKDQNLGEKICVYIRNQEETLQLHEVRNYLISNKVAAFKLPDQIRYLTDWPLTNVGKIDRKELKKMGEAI